MAFGTGKRRRYLAVVLAAVVIVVIAFAVTRGSWERQERDISASFCRGPTPPWRT